MTASNSAADQQTSSTRTGSSPRTAAFFDLDNTIIAKSSTLAFSKPFFDQGLINRRAVLKSSYAQFLFLLSGADHDQMDRM
ncbi:MAG TPA: HAD-IB family hydrolase, partial [Mycobacterium sp.]|nr:HAD-IB family hydrolase [Mycobacterium sp.]